MAHDLLLVSPFDISSTGAELKAMDLMPGLQRLETDDNAGGVEAESPRSKMYGCSRKD